MLFKNVLQEGLRVCSSLTCSGGAWVQVSKMKEEVPLPLPPKEHPPALVLGGDRDLIVDVQALEESAEVYGVQPVILKNAAHDVMLVIHRPDNRCAGSFACSFCSAACPRAPAVMPFSMPCMHGAIAHCHREPMLLKWHAGYKMARSCRRSQPLAVNFMIGS